MLSLVAELSNRVGEPNVTPRKLIGGGQRRQDDRPIRWIVTEQSQHCLEADTVGDAVVHADVDRDSPTFDRIEDVDEERWPAEVEPHHHVLLDEGVQIVISERGVAAVHDDVPVVVDIIGAHPHVAVEAQRGPS